MADIDVWFPRKLAFLRDPRRYNILYGGRASIKSWTIAQFLLKTGSERPSLSGLSSASLTSFRGYSRAFSITYASFSPAAMFTALTAYPGTVVRRLYRQGGAFATS